MSNDEKKVLSDLEPEQLAQEVAERQVAAVTDALEKHGTFDADTIAQVATKTEEETRAEVLACLGKAKSGAVMAVATAFYPPLSVPNLGTTVEGVPE